MSNFRTAFGPSLNSHIYAGSAVRTESSVSGKISASDRKREGELSREARNLAEKLGQSLEFIRGCFKFYSPKEDKQKLTLADEEEGMMNMSRFANIYQQEKVPGYYEQAVDSALKKLNDALPEEKRGIYTKEAVFPPKENLAYEILYWGGDFLRESLMSETFYKLRKSADTEEQKADLFKRYFRDLGFDQNSVDTLFRREEETPGKTFAAALISKTLEVTFLLRHRVILEAGLIVEETLREKGAFETSPEFVLQKSILQKGYLGQTSGPEYNRLAQVRETAYNHLKSSGLTPLTPAESVVTESAPASSEYN